ncbi:hypothetical protein GCM10010112_87770 [Actinoplanes lobatus]|uniref:Uncharacterized protein n=1 Tax=Actinoplanes lobatus TaxID=113568 RepID=A0A7W7HR65_9ACTN|nr:hypothetical protein [Actinoplanes lobatus]MBB4755140.1 hypothetical protein [Actinoplanes lobatus]GGN96486.1 hypothetical protein GCM10010112_87770 [Actinoplanes lobatus]GIE45385.1 hypothetical protein Alo02nite_82830 [Actinoplanes lobatus]
MSAITSYARALAVDAGRAFPIAARRHLHLADRPLVFLPLTLAGEANAPLAAMLGTDPANPRILVVPQPRNRDLRFAFAAELADIVVPYIEGRARQVETYGRQGRLRHLDAPQVLVPNPAGLAFVRLFGRSTRFRRTTGEYAVPMRVPLLGRWLTHLAERAEHPGSSTLVAMTSALGLHWATGQSALEDANLATQLAWIDPPAGLTGPEAAARAEDPIAFPPAGPTTDPTFDSEVLERLIRAYHEGDQDRAVERLTAALRTQLEPTWNLMWQAIDLLRALPAGDTVEDRWATDRTEFTNFREYLNQPGSLPQARRDGAVAAARRLQRLEKEQSAYDATRALDDPLVMAAHRVTGEAFAGTVVQTEPARKIVSDKGRRVNRPLIVVHTTDPVLLVPNTTVRAPSRLKQDATVLAVDGDRITLQIENGMGRGATPAPGSVPEVGEEITYTSVFPDDIRSPDLPSADDTPWTHGGPPRPYQPTDDDAREVWE